MDGCTVDSFTCKYKHVQKNPLERGAAVITTQGLNCWNQDHSHMSPTPKDPGISAGSTVQFLLRSCFIAGEIISRSSSCVQECMPTIVDFIIWCKNLLHFLGVSWISMLRPGIEPTISFTGAHDYACSAVANWTTYANIPTTNAFFSLLL